MFWNRCPNRCSVKTTVRLRMAMHAHLAEGFVLENVHNSATSEITAAIRETAAKTRFSGRYNRNINGDTSNVRPIAIAFKTRMYTSLTMPMDIMVLSRRFSLFLIHFLKDKKKNKMIL